MTSAAARGPPCQQSFLPATFRSRVYRFCCQRPVCSFQGLNEGMSTQLGSRRDNRAHSHISGGDTVFHSHISHNPTCSSLLLLCCEFMVGMDPFNLSIHSLSHFFLPTAPRLLNLLTHSLLFLRHLFEHVLPSVFPCFENSGCPFSFTFNIHQFVECL